MEPSDTAPSPLPEDDGTLPFEKDVGASLSLADVPLPGTADNSFPAYDPADDTYDESMLPNDSIMALPADIPPMPEGSMPTPREHRQSDPARNARMTFICRISVILMSVLLFVVALTFLLARVSRGNDTTTTPKTAAPTAPPLEDIAAYLTTHGASSLTELMTPNTPQNLALHWLAVGDPAPEAVPDVGISEPEGYLYVVRYVMAVHYFSLNGDDWTKTTGFLTGNHVCDWNGYSFSFDNSGGIENGGLSCDAESKMPNILDLGECCALCSFLYNIVPGRENRVWCGVCVHVSHIVFVDALLGYRI